MVNKTIIFENRYLAYIGDFPTTKEVDTFLEVKLGRPLRVISLNVDVDKELDKVCLK
jgi:hypothetical protein